MAEKVVNGFENYTVDEQGNIYSICSKKYLKPSRNKNGYMMVELFNEKEGKNKLVHRVVAEAFIPNPNNYPQVNHKDENKLNNNVTNLEWCTAKYNMNYGKAAKTRHSKIDYSKQIYKDSMKKAYDVLKKSVIQCDPFGNVINKFKSITEASKNTNISRTNIGRSANGKRKTAGGFIWKFM